MCRPRIHDMPFGSTRPTHHASRQPACAAGQASKLSADSVLQHLFVERQVCDYPLQLGVLVLELLQPAHLGRQQPVVLLLPIEVGRLANTGLAANVRHRHSIGALLQNERLLGVRKSRCLHRSPLLPARESARKTLAKNGPVLRSQITGSVLTQMPLDATFRNIASSVDRSS